jgi:hemerythrin
MSLIEWDQSYSVSIAQFDRQHQKLFSLLNELHEAMSGGRSHAVLGKVLDELIAYTGTHFAAEEKVMAEKHYPGLAEHKRAHDELVGRVMAFRGDFIDGKAGVSQEVLDFLREWLNAHIRGTDRQYGGYLNEKGVH